MVAGISSYFSSKRSVHYSALLHALMLALIVFGLPHFIHHEEMTDTGPVPIEVIPAPAKPPHAIIVPQHHADAPPPAPPRHSDVPQTTSHSTPVKPLRHHAASEPDFTSVLNRLAQSAAQNEPPAPTQTAHTGTREETPARPAVHESFSSMHPLTSGQEDQLREQIRQFWNAPVGAKDAEHLKVNLRLKLSPDGTVLDAELAEDLDRYRSDSFFAAAADAAMRAVRRASPLKGLPADTYGSWSEMDLTFDPSSM